MAGLWETSKRVAEPEVVIQCLGWCLPSADPEICKPLFSPQLHWREDPICLRVKSFRDRGSKHGTLCGEATPGQTVAYALELPAMPLPVHSKFQQAWWITSCLWERALVERRHKKSTLTISCE